MKPSAIWQIEGILKTRTPLHIGNGGVRLRPTGRITNGEQEAAEIQTVCKTLDGRAVIPGSALKGVVRGALDLLDSEVLRLFGEQKQGGLVQFLDSCSRDPIDWSKQVLTRTAIDAVYGTAQNRYLFQVEEVPEDTEFLVRIRGKSFGLERWQDAVGLLSAGMAQFSAEELRLGAGAVNGRGLCAWELLKVRVMESGELSEWYGKPKPLDKALGDAPDHAMEIRERITNAAPGKKTLNLQLCFDEHHFLVNDAEKTGKREDGKHAHAAKRTGKGHLRLPAESFRGALGHQAARIARTRGQNGDRVTVNRTADGKLPEIESATTRLFGAPGWGSVLEFGDFVEVSQKGRPFPDTPKTQEFLAVDRFTGGGVEARKFDAEGGWQPVLQGRVTVDLKRLAAIGKVAPALGLLSLTLRDLIEGDLSLGWGSGKGYGWAKVETGELSATEWIDRSLAGWWDGTVKEWIAAWEGEGL